jgi:hypothetical protein
MLRCCAEIPEMTDTVAVTATPSSAQHGTLQVSLSHEIFTLRNA